MLFSRAYFLLDLKKQKYLKRSTRIKAKMFFHFYLLILCLPYVLPVNTFPFLYQTASLANILFFAALTNNDINKVSALSIKIIFLEKKLYSFFRINKKRLLTDIGSRRNCFHKNLRKSFLLQA